MSTPLAAIVGVRFSGHLALVWFRAGEVPATIGSWVIADRSGIETVGEVVVGRGQCLTFPADPEKLPVLVREARPDERPIQPGKAGRALLDSLPRAVVRGPETVPAREWDREDERPEGE